MADRATLDVYESRAADYARSRPPIFGDRARALARRCLPGLPIADLGSGPGGYLHDLAANGNPVIAIDAADAMLRMGREVAADVPGVRGDLEHLPLRHRSLGGAWSRNAHLHVARAALPMALADLHRALRVGAPLVLALAEGEGEGVWDGGALPGRFFANWRAEEVSDVLVGAGFEDVEVRLPPAGEDDLWATARRARTLPDYVGPGMRLLVCGLNPSVVSADAGVGYATPSNRFWPAAVAAGLVARPRDPVAALREHGIGMTDLVKRATPNASGITAMEYLAGTDRVRRLVARLRPRAVVFVGLAGWRAALDRGAVAGAQRAPFAGVPAYVMPSTSGLNAHARPADLAAHLRAAAALADASG